MRFGTAGGILVALPGDASNVHSALSVIAAVRLIAPPQPKHESRRHWTVAVRVVGVEHDWSQRALRLTDGQTDAQGETAVFTRTADGRIVRVGELHIA